MLTPTLTLRSVQSKKREDFPSPLLGVFGLCFCIALLHALLRNLDLCLDCLTLCHSGTTQVRSLLNTHFQHSCNVSSGLRLACQNRANLLNKGAFSSAFFDTAFLRFSLAASIFFEFCGSHLHILISPFCTATEFSFSHNRSPFLVATQFF